MCATATMKNKAPKIVIVECENIRVVIATHCPPEYLEIQRDGKPIYKAKSKKKVKATAAIWKDAGR